MFSVFKEIFCGIYLLVIYLKKKQQQQTKNKPKRTQINTSERWCLSIKQIFESYLCLCSVLYH